jgi:hypothetical protein
MLKKALVVLVVFMTSSIFAGSHTWTTHYLVDQLYINQAVGGANSYAHIGLSNGATYVFDITTPEGQLWYKTINDAVVQSKYVQIRYIPDLYQTFNYQNTNPLGTSTETANKVIGVDINR